MWKKLGVNVKLANTELKVRFANLRQCDFEIGALSWNADYNDAEDFLFKWRTSKNQARLSNGDYDRLMDEAAVTGDRGKRARLLRQAEQILLREMPVVPLFFDASKKTWSARGSRAGRTICRTVAAHSKQRVSGLPTQSILTREQESQADGGWDPPL
jgi:oligopeptide transport system substrate-binding protein